MPAKLKRINEIQLKTDKQEGVTANDHTTKGDDFENKYEQQELRKYKAIQDYGSLGSEHK